MYLPTLGRFQSRDPLPLEGEPDLLYGNEWINRNVIAKMNLYIYVDNNSVNQIDPSGLAPEDSKMLQIVIRQQPKLTGSCGGVDGHATYVLASRFGKEPAPILLKPLAGTVVQLLKMEIKSYHCKDTEEYKKGKLEYEFSALYYEGFPVKGSIVFINSARTKAMEPWGMFDDVLTIDDRPKKTWGKATVTGCVQYLPDLKFGVPPWKEEGDKSLPPLPRTGGVPVMIPPTTPKGFKKDDAKCRSITVEWDCCACPPTNEITEESGWEDVKK